MQPDTSHPLVGRTARLVAGPLSGIEGTVAWFEPPDRLAISLGSGIVALVRTSDVKFESDPDDLAVPQSR
jgi:hypothetical protein